MNCAESRREILTGCWAVGIVLEKAKVRQPPEKERQSLIYSASPRVRKCGVKRPAPGWVD